jgi:hypothetical protein
MTTPTTANPANFLHALASVIEGGLPCPVSITISGDSAQLQYGDADISGWTEVIGGELGFKYLQGANTSDPYAMHEVVRPERTFAGFHLKSWVAYDLTRDVVGADGCGCPITDLLYANGSSVSLYDDSATRTEHRVHCALVTA